ncbi:MAG: hypothetical protein GF375_04960 [Candidatus Omnitrophica bacterium]|nr:hypothetical protein [Candidatus Omnitrophota bacterium]
MTNFLKAQKRKQTERLRAENKALKQQVADLKANLEPVKDTDKRNKIELKNKIKSLEKSLKQATEELGRANTNLKLADSLVNAISRGDMVDTMEIVERYKKFRGILSVKVGANGHFQKTEKAKANKATPQGNKNRDGEAL